MRQRRLLILCHKNGCGRAFLLLTLIVMLSGCGWHLRGSFELPASMDRLYVKGAARYSELGVVIHDAFQSSNSILVDSPSQAKAILHILSDKTEQRILATDSSGRALEYEISYLLRFQVMDIQGEALVRDQQVKIKREYKYDPTNVLATSGEVQRLKKDMIRASVQQMLRRINASLQNI